MLTTGWRTDLAARRKLGRVRWSERRLLIEHALAECASSWPRVYRRIVRVGVGPLPPGDVARADTFSGFPTISTITFSRDFLLHPDSDEFLRNEFYNNRSTSMSFRGVAFHEFGHLVSHYALLGMFDPSNRTVSAQQQLLGYRVLRAKACNNVVGSGWISALAASSDEEWCAEAFAAAICWGTPAPVHELVAVCGRSEPSWL